MPLATIERLPWFICPNCKQRTVDLDWVEGFSEQAVACRHCGFGFLFELMDDYYPAPTTGFVVCDAEGRILALGRGVFELSGFQEQDILGQEVMGAFQLSGFEDGKNPQSWRASGACAVSERSSNFGPGPGSPSA